MHRFIKQTALLAGALFLGACGGAQDAQRDAAPQGGKSIAQGEVCPTVSAGPPAVCPDGCVWNGTECRANRPIVIFDQPILPPATNSAPIATPPSQPPASGP